MDTLHLIVREDGKLYGLINKEVKPYQTIRDAIRENKILVANPEKAAAEMAAIAQGEFYEWPGEFEFKDKKITLL